MNALTIKIAGVCCCLLATGHVKLAAGPALTIKDTIGREWVNEPIVWELTGVMADTVRLQRDGRPIPVQVAAKVECTVIYHRSSRGRSHHHDRRLDRTR
jgi:hypothetical protein